MKVIKVITDWSGYVSAVSLFVLTVSIFYGVVTRVFSIQDAFSYDISLYGLVWFSMLGAGWLARTGKNVTAGISVENYLHTRIPIFPILRSLLVIAVMVLLMWAGFHQSWTSFVAHEKTMSIAQLPVWISEIPIPLGAFAWIIGEIGRLIETVVSSE